MGIVYIILSRQAPESITTLSDQHVPKHVWSQSWVWGALEIQAEHKYKSNEEQRQVTMSVEL